MPKLWTVNSNSDPTGATPAGSRPAPRPVKDDSNPALRKLAWVAGLSFAFVMIAAWIFGLFIYDPGLLVDELEDRSFGEAAEVICSEHTEAVSTLPRAENAEDPGQRADVITEANGYLTAMVNQLWLEVPSDPPVASEAVEEWLGDWETHIEDRQEYADALRDDPQARFAESAKGTRQVSRAIDGFAQVNRMTSCETTGDVG